MNPQVAFHGFIFPFENLYPHLPFGRLAFFTIKKAYRSSYLKKVESKLEPWIATWHSAHDWKRLA